MYALITEVYEVLQVHRDVLHHHCCLNGRLGLLHYLIQLLLEDVLLLLRLRRRLRREVLMQIGAALADRVLGRHHTFVDLVGKDILGLLADVVEVAERVPIH